MAHTNVIFDTFARGIETLLRTEFKTSAAVYISEEPVDQVKPSIRIWPLGFEAVDPPFLAVAQEYRYDAELVIAMRAGDRKETTDARLDVMSQALRKLNDNKNYSPSSVYSWHDGTGDEGEKTEEGWRFVYSATVTESIA